MKEIPSDIILKLNQEAEEKIKVDQSIINGTIGMLFNDDRHLAFNKTLSDLISLHNKEEDLVYSTVSGTNDYKSAIYKWFIKDYTSISMDEFKFISTPGGTGACSISIHDTLKDKNSVLIIPEISWPNYLTIASLNNIEVYKYKNYDKDHFNIKDIESYIKDNYLSKTISILINDPCQNPTGYAIKKDEWNQIIDIIKKYNINNNISLILDLAYFDYANLNEKQNVFNAIFILKEYVNIYICFSFSKTFSMYGLRLGALAMLLKYNKEVIFKEACLTARGLWSNVNHLGMNVVSDLVNDENTLLNIRSMIEENIKLVQNRADIFLKEAKEVILKYYPYNSGFFITIPVKDSLAVVEELKKEKLYIVPINLTTIRISLSCIPTKDIYSIAKKIKLAMEKIEND